MPTSRSIKSTTGRDKDVDLQIVRAIAALLVIVDHTILSMLRSQNVLEQHQQLASFAATLGGMGVCAFFALSGYIMLETNPMGFPRRWDAVHFMIRRFLRIAPIYYLGSMIAFVLLALSLGKAGLVSEFFYSFLFLPHYTNIENEGFFPILGVGWTLNMEMFFYLLFAIAMWRLPRNGPWIVAGAIIGLMLAGRLLERAGVISDQNPLYFYTKTPMLMFGLGILLSRYKASLATLLKLVRGALDFHILLIGLILVAMAYALGLHMLKPLGKLIEMLATLLVLSAVLYTIRLPQKIRNLFAFLGDASYSIYIFHTPILLITVAINQRPGLHIEQGFLLFGINLVVALCGSLICYWWIERPLRKNLEKPVRRWLDANYDRNSVIYLPIYPAPMDLPERFGDAIAALFTFRRRRGR